MTVGSEMVRGGWGKQDAVGTAKGGGGRVSCAGVGWRGGAQTVLPFGGRKRRGGRLPKKPGRKKEG